MGSARAAIGGSFVGAAAFGVGDKIGAAGRRVVREIPMRERERRD